MKRKPTLILTPKKKETLTFTPKKKIYLRGNNINPEQMAITRLPRKKLA